MKAKWLSCIFLAAALAGCGAKPAAAPKQASDPAAEKKDGFHVTEAEFTAAKKIWPLNVSEAAVGCTAPGALWVMSDGDRFGLNEWASPAEGYLDLSVIRKVDDKAMEEKAKATKKRREPEKEKKRGKKKGGPPPIYIKTDDLVALAKSKCG